MRERIWKKNDYFQISGKRIEMDPLIVELPEEAPLTYYYNWASDPVGKVTELRLEDGEITGEVEVFDHEFDEETLDKLGCRLGGYYRSVTYDDDRQSSVKSAKLVGVSFVLKHLMPGWPKDE